MIASFLAIGKEKVFFIVVVLLCIVNGFLYMARQEINQETVSLQKANEAALAFQNKPASFSFRKGFLKTLLSAELNTGDAAAMLRKVGFQTEEIYEETVITTAQGEERKIRFTGYGKFTQILRLFDVINERKERMSLHIHRLERKNGALFLDGEIRMFQYQGNHEKKR